MSISAVRNKHDWNRFKIDLIKTFRPVNKDFDIRSKLLKLKELENFDKYLFEFRTLINQIPDDKMSKLDKFTTFVSGLRSKTRFEIFKLRLTTLDEAIELACFLNSTSEVISENKGSTSEINITQTEPRHFTEDIGNESNKETNRTKRQGFVKNKVKCYNCGGVGHMRQDCPSSSADREGSENEDKEVDKDDINSARREFSGNYTKKYSAKKNKDHVVCWNCNGSGHYANECHNNTASSNLIEAMDSDESELNCMELLDVFSSDGTEIVQGVILKSYSG